MRKNAAIATGAVIAALVACANAGARPFPTPACGWVTATSVGRAIGEPVKSFGSRWSDVHAPILTCAYEELVPNLQLGYVPIVQIQYAENQFYKLAAGSVPVPGLGSCVRRSSCPRSGEAAWTLSTTRTLSVVGSPTTNGTPTNPASPQIERFVGAQALFAQDGLNAVAIAVSTPNGPLQVRNETAALVHLIRGVLARFYWS